MEEIDLSGSLPLSVSSPPTSVSVSETKIMGKFSAVMSAAVTLAQADNWT